MDMQKIAAKLATKYGEVTSGKYKGCQVALGNDPDPNKKVEGSDNFTQIIFVENDTEKGRYDIESLKEVAHIEEIEGAIQVKIVFEDDDECVFDLKILPDDKFPMTLIKPLLMQEEPISERTPNNKYRRVYVFFMNVMSRLADEEMRYFLLYFTKKQLFKDPKWLKIEKERLFRNILKRMDTFNQDQLMWLSALIGVHFPDDTEMRECINTKLGISSDE